MAAPLLQSFATLVSNQVAAMQTSAAALVSFTTGAILRAVANASAALGMWLQGLALQNMARTRFATSYGADADSWGLDWGFFRLPAMQSTTTETFSCYTSAVVNRTVPVGAIVQTQDKTQQFTVIADPTNGAWNGSNGYTLLAGQTSVTAKVQSVNAAAAANVIAGAINTMFTAIPGIDFVSNGSQAVGGADAESDESFKARFPTFLASLARATGGAIQAAIESIQVGIVATVEPNVNYDGTSNPGHLTIFVDDGSGAPSGALLDQARAITALYVAESISFSIFSTTIITVNVSYTLAVASTFTKATLITQSQNAVIGFVDAIADGGSLSWSQLYQVIYNSSPGITDVTNLLVNGATADIVPANIYDVIKTGTVVGS